MKLKFCGAAGTVTGSSHLITLDNGVKILMDCGLYQGREKEFIDFNRAFLFDPAEIDILIISHAHIDHTGRIPALIKSGFRGEIYATNATRDLCALMLVDSGHIQESDIQYVNKKRLAKGEKPLAPLYTVEDARASLHYFVGIPYNREKWLAPGITLKFRDAGHILGSASIILTIEEHGKTTKIGFSGDIGRPNRPILRDPVPMETVDYLLCESTYGGELHKQKPDEEQLFLDILTATCVEKKGNLIIPSFSVGRTQELVYILNSLYEEGRLPQIPVYVDSPLAVNATQVFILHPECYDKETHELMLKDPEPFGFRGLTYIRDVYHSKMLNKKKDEPKIIISASGMLTAGRIKHHLYNNIEDPKNTVLMVGYVPPYTLGYFMKKGEKQVRIFGDYLNLNADVKVMDSFSAHGDDEEMTAWLSKLDKSKLKTLFLVHGEPDRQNVFKKNLQDKGFGDIQLPKLGEEIVL